MTVFSQMQTHLAGIVNKLIPVFLTALLTSTCVVAAEPIPVGYVDMQQIMGASTVARQAAADSERATEAARGQLEVEQRAIAQMQKDFARDEAIMSESQRNTRQQAIQERMKAYEKLAADLQQQINQQRLALAEKALGPVQEAIDAIAREEGVIAVFERSESGLLYLQDGRDLTAKVIERLKAAEGKQ